MKTYVVNLKRATDRKKYMQGQLEKLPFLMPEFIEAVDGREMEDMEKQKRFDCDSFRRRYAKEVRPGEIGCTLSHQKCYRKLLDSEEECVLLLEDDVILNEDMQGVIREVEKHVSVEEPRIVLLSGWYWYWRGHRFCEKYRLADVYDGFLTHAYVINRNAARLLLEERPAVVADAWKYWRQKGIHLQALCPHLIDPDSSGQYPTAISDLNNPWVKGMWGGRLKTYMQVVVLKLLGWMGRGEKPYKPKE